MTPLDLLLYIGIAIAGLIALYLLFHFLVFLGCILILIAGFVCALFSRD